jgi:hypothetical protein
VIVVPEEGEMYYFRLKQELEIKIKWWMGWINEAFFYVK